MTNTKLLLATTNDGKIKEIRAFLRPLPFEIFSLKELNVRTFFPEREQTFLANAEGKSLYYSRTWEGLILGEDSGLEIECLDGAPGVISARFSGPGATDEKNIRKALDLMEGMPQKSRQARFVCWMVLSLKGKVLTHIREEAQGYIITEKKGLHGFGYDPIFFYPPLQRTFAELIPDEKNKVSHRGRALSRLREYLENYARRVSCA